MGNGGFYGTKEEWKRMEAPLLKLDARLELFAASSGMSLDKNFHGQINRYFMRNDGITRILQIFLSDKSQMTFSLGIAAWKGGAKRFSKSELIISKQSIDEISENLELILAKAKERLDSWQESDLKLIERPTPNSGPNK